MLLREEQGDVEDESEEEQLEDATVLLLSLRVVGGIGFIISATFL